MTLKGVPSVAMGVSQEDVERTLKEFFKQLQKPPMP